MECETPREAFEVLRERKRACYDGYQALYGGNVRELIRTAPPGSFWARPGKSRIHVPLAADLAATSANLLFGEELRLQLAGEAGQEGEGQKRLADLMLQSGLSALLCEAAEYAAALGDVCLKLNWDRKCAPLLTVVHAGDALPEYRMGRLHCLHFFTPMKDDGRHVWRVWERYSPGEIEMGLFRGTRESLGEDQGESGLRSLGFGRHVRVPVEDMLAIHVPNMRPNRQHPDSGMGRSDLEGLRGLMDALDEAYSSWMRDIRLAKSRLIVPAEYLRRRPRDLFRDGQYTYEFDEDVETLVALDIDTSHAGTDMITPSQFRIRTGEHLQTCEHLIRSIVTMAGYSPQTFGMDVNGRAESGTALQMRERKSYATRGKKENYWKGPLETILTSMIRLDAKLHPGVFHDRDAVSVIFPDATANDLTTLASAVKLLREAGIMSREEGVGMVHPDWTGEMVKAEVERLEHDG